MFDEDLSIYLADFGVDASVNAESGKVIFDAPDNDFLGDMQLITDYLITYPASQFTTLKRGNTVTVDGIEYVSKETRKIGDGKWKTTGLTPI